MRPRFFLCAIFLFSFAVMTGHTATAQQLWSEPGEPVALNDAQTQALTKLSDAMGEIERYMAAEACYVNGNGKCVDPSQPDVGQKQVVEQFVATAKSCAELSRAALQAGIPATQPVDFDRHHQPDFDKPISLRNAEHFCNQHRGFAERHLAFFDRSVAGAVFSDYEAQSAASEVGDSVDRMLNWQALYECYQKSDKCESQPDMREAESVSGWVRDGEGCLADVKNAHEKEVADDMPVAFMLNNVAGLQSPEILAVAADYCEKQTALAKSVADKIAAAAQAAQATTQTTETPPAEPENKFSPEQQAILDKLYQNSPQVVAAIDAHTNPDSSNADDLKSTPIVQFWVENAKECAALVGSALQAGVPSDYPFEFPTYESGLKSPMPLAQYDQEICAKAQQLSEATLNKANAKENAIVGPYLAVLKGDRLRLFKEHKLHTRSVRGPGGVELTTPEQFVESPAWYTTSEDRSGASPRWIIGGWQFDGDKVLRNYSDSDWGLNPPSDRYPSVRGGSGGSGSASSGGGFLSFVVWLLILTVVFGAVGLAAYAYLGLKVAMVERILDKAPPARNILNKIPKKN